ncbi:MAG: thiamine pyrophosphate-binding protein [Methylococcales bacterium]|nr:thiamine pyrophosphate-binding protein [Methylococcales bacterium]
MKASDALTQFLLNHRIQTCFELAGGMITHILDSFAATGQFNIISMHHEQSAAFAAEGVARYAKGKTLAVALATSGPGATNLITGIGSCWFDSIPCLFITGQVNSHELKGGLAVRQQGFQELDIVQVAQPLTKYAHRVDSADALLPAVHKALSIALDGRQGPVLLDIPNDVQCAEIADAVVGEWLRTPLQTIPAHKADSAAFDVLAALCGNAQKPLLCIGGGARWADGLNDWLLDAEAAGIPYVATLMGQERLPAGQAYFNMIGSYGNRTANWAIQNCDLLLVVGARLDVRQTGADTGDFARNAVIVQIDIDPAQLNNRIKAALNICIAAADFFKAFQLRTEMFPKLDSGWLSLLSAQRQRFQADEYPDWRISPCEIFRLLNQKLAGQPVAYVCDVGNHQMWAAQNIRLSAGQSVHHSGGMGAMGFALPAALGIALESRQKVVVITGDGSMQINIQELDTLDRLQLDIAIIVLNNAMLGMVKNFQDMYFDGRDQSTKKGYSSPAFARIAAAYGIDSHRIERSEDIDDCLNLLAGRKGPLLIEIVMDDAKECRPRLVYGAKLDRQYPEP